MSGQTLADIMHFKKVEVALLRQQIPYEQMVDTAITNKRKVMDFRGAIRGADRLSLIAEVKMASPSEGPITNASVEDLVRLYTGSGMVDAISVVTEKKYFQGDANSIPIAKLNTTLPVLRKDFIFDEYQVHESYVLGADAMLLIAAALEQSQLRRLIQVSSVLGIQPLVEVHSEAEIESALKAGAVMIGINARDLNTFEIDHNLFSRLVPHIPEGIVKVAESGIATRDDAQRVRDAGADAILVGASILRSNDPVKKVAELMP